MRIKHEKLHTYCIYKYKSHISIDRYVYIYSKTRADRVNTILFSLQYIILYGNRFCT